MGFLRKTKLSDPIAVPFSKRSVVNLSYINDVAHYPFINHVLESDNFASPSGAAFVGVNPSWPEMLDQVTGYPNHANASGHEWGGGLKFPDSSKFDGPYVITWDGTGTLYMSAATWTESNNTGTTYTKISNGRWSNVAGQSARIIATLSSWLGAPNIFGFQFAATGGPDGFVRNFRVYRLEDESDLLAGRVFRRAYLQQIADHDPSALRVMNWSGGNDAQGMRFENRCLPNYASYGNNVNFIQSPLYGTTTGVNQYVLPSINTGVRQTPASVTHGETVICRMGSSAVGVDGPRPMTSVTSAATPRVVTSVPHGFTNAQVIMHRVAVGNGVPKLDFFPATINVINTTTYDITNLNLTGQAAFVAGQGCDCYVYVSLNVGLRGDYPIVWSTGNVGAGIFGNGYVNQNDLQTFYFDKTIIGKSDGAGNYVNGAWIFAGSGAAYGHWDGVPLEILTKLIIELNQTGPKNPISLWICYPHRMMLSIDPDYSAASNWAVKATDVILNGSTVGGVTWPGLLTGATGAMLYIEYCNEIWNTAPTFNQSHWHSWYSRTRWGTSYISKRDAHALRSTAMARDIKAAFPSEARIKIVFGMHAASGMTAGDISGNHGAWNGSSTPGTVGYNYNTDSVVVAGSWGPPKNWHDAVAPAPYFEAGPTYYAGSGAGTLTDDSHMYAGTGPYAGAPNQTQALTNFVNAMATATDGLSLTDHLARHTQFTAQMGAGQYVVQYEGAGNWSTTPGTNLYGHSLTAADEQLMIAAYRCAQMGTTLVNYFNTICAMPKTAMPSIFLSVNVGYRWSFGAPDSYGLTSTEGGVLTTCPAWVAVNARNNSVA
jgi:hypothetical protein